MQGFQGFYLDNVFLIHFVFKEPAWRDIPRSIMTKIVIIVWRICCARYSTFLYWYNLFRLFSLQKSCLKRYLLWQCEKKVIIVWGIMQSIQGFYLENDCFGRFLFKNNVLRDVSHSSMAKNRNYSLEDLCTEHSRFLSRELLLRSFSF